MAKNTKAKAEAAVESAFKVGDKVTYVPNGTDFGSKPKMTPVPGTIINVSEQSAVLADDHDKHGKKGQKFTRTRYNIIVLQDTDAGFARKVNVSHKDDAIEGEVYFE